MIVFLLFILILSILTEGTVTTLPLTLICLICFTVLRRDTSVFPFAFIAGIFIDVFRVQPVGATSIFYIGFLFFILLYQKKYEIYSMPFVMLASFFGAFAYLMVFGHTYVPLLSAVSAVFAGLLFGIIRLFVHAKTRNRDAQFKPV